MNRFYTEYAEHWKVMRDCYDGVTAIKSFENCKRYLRPFPSELGSEIGNDVYLSRLHLAYFDNVLRPVVDAIVGMMQKNPAKVKFGMASDDESPQEVRDLNVYGNAQNDGLSGLKWRLNHAQTLYGRAGLLLGIENGQENRPRFTIREYATESILDGEPGEWALLDESTEIFDSVTKKWKTETRWRVLGVDADGRYYTCPIVGELTDVQRDWERFDLFSPTGQVVYPTFRGKSLPFVPFTVCNATRIGINAWQMPPFYNVADLTLALYNSDSFYRRTVANHATPTLVAKNAVQNVDKNGNDRPLTLGGVLYVRSDNEHPADLSLLETSGSGLSEMRAAKEDIRSSLKRISVQDLLDGSGANSSGKAIQLRTTSGTASIAAIDRAGGKAIEEQLVFAAIWAGATRDEAGQRITYEADTSYLDVDFNLSELVSFLNVNSDLGGDGPFLSDENAYALLQKAVPNVLTDFHDNRRMIQERRTADPNSTWTKTGDTE